MNIYLDTNLWNALCDQEINQMALVDALAARGANLVLGLRVFYELSRTFTNGTRKVLERGTALFSYLKPFVDANIICVKENEEILAAEMWFLKLRSRRVDAFLGKEDLEKIQREVDRLASGGFDERTSKFIDDGRAFSSKIRSGQKRLVDARPDLKQELSDIAPEKVAAWLQQELLKPDGPEWLRKQIMRRFPEAQDIEAWEYASALLSCPACRMSRGFVHAGSYYTWRCAYRDSVPADLLDDTFHVLNAVHCDVYATGEPRQQEYASLLLTADTKVVIYDGGTPIDEWILALA